MTRPFDKDADARGLLCPLPVLRARKILLGMASGEVLRIAATDPAAVLDMPHFAREAGHEFLGQEAAPEGAAYYYFKRA